MSAAMYVSPSLAGTGGCVTVCRVQLVFALRHSLVFTACCGSCCGVVTKCGRVITCSAEQGSSCSTAGMSMPLLSRHSIWSCAAPAAPAAPAAGVVVGDDETSEGPMRAGSSGISSGLRLQNVSSSGAAAAAAAGRAAGTKAVTSLHAGCL
jgi:hypothetical protein